MIFNFGKVCSDGKAKIRRTMSGSTVGLQWVYSGSTLTNRLRISGGKRDKRRCEPHRQMKNKRRMVKPMEKVR
ncbi:hypothetical protein [Capnocytophaga ochracea]|uniref:hypothetical protein n=1 Tax=Capnocytophaga ochracea TaxID=1018 RepID=UPI0015F043D9|nr:hypothetical protein [Capnocytophaga ochracea]